MFLRFTSCGKADCYASTRTESATCPTTRESPAENVREGTRDPVFSLRRAPLTPLYGNAGTMTRHHSDSMATPTVKMRTRASSRTSNSRGEYQFADKNAASECAAQNAKTTPKAAPMKRAGRFSVSNCGSVVRAPRPAQTARPFPFSRTRGTASIRPATFAHVSARRCSPRHQDIKRFRNLARIPLNPWCTGTKAMPGLSASLKRVPRHAARCYGKPGWAAAEPVSRDRPRLGRATIVNHQPGPVLGSFALNTDRAAQFPMRSSKANGSHISWALPGVKRVNRGRPTLHHHNWNIV